MKQIILRGAIITAVSGIFAVPAYAEDTGLINALNAQTRAQVQAHEALKQKLRDQRSEPRGPSGNLGTRN